MGPTCDQLKLTSGHVEPTLGRLWPNFARLGANLGTHGAILARTWALMGRYWRQLGPSGSDFGANFRNIRTILGSLRPPSGQQWANLELTSSNLGLLGPMGVILGPFWNNFEAICQVKLSSRSFHALSCPVASSTVYRARPLVCRVVKAVVSCAALADCFDSCIHKKSERHLT